MAGTDRRTTGCSPPDSRVDSESIQTCTGGQTKSDTDDDRLGSPRHTHSSASAGIMGETASEHTRLHSTQAATSVYRGYKGMASSIILRPARGRRILRCRPRILDTVSTTTLPQSGPAESIPSQGTALHMPGAGTTGNLSLDTAEQDTVLVPDHIRARFQTSEDDHQMCMDYLNTLSFLGFLTDRNNTDLSQGTLSNI